MQPADRPERCCAAKQGKIACPGAGDAAQPAGRPDRLHVAKREESPAPGRVARYIPQTVIANPWCSSSRRRIFCSQATSGRRSKISRGHRRRRCAGRRRGSASALGHGSSIAVKDANSAAGAGATGTGAANRHRPLATPPTDGISALRRKKMRSPVECATPAIHLPCRPRPPALPSSVGDPRPPPRQRRRVGHSPNHAERAQR